MADTTKNGGEEKARPQTTGTTAGTQPGIHVLGQYVKDLSFENPNAPAVYQWQGQPQIDVQFNIGARKINDEITEVELKVSASAKTAQGAAYIVELAYCGLVGMRNMSEDQKHAFTYAEGPRILFPFARRIISEATVDAGFPPLLLDPIDFAGLYMQRAAQQQAEASGGQAGDVTGQA